MTSKLPDFDRWIDAVAPLVQIEIAADYRPGVKANLKTASKMAALLDKVSTKGETDPAPVFRA